MNIFWICDGIPPKVPPCGAEGTKEGAGKGTAHQHTTETGHSTLAAMLPGTTRRLRDLAAKGADR